MVIFCLGYKTGHQQSKISIPCTEQRHGEHNGNICNDSGSKVAQFLVAVADLGGGMDGALGAANGLLVALTVAEFN